MEDCCIVLVVYSCLCIITGAGAAVYECIDGIEKPRKNCQQKVAEVVTTVQPV